jgi:mediator of RNA polymerase II transcription subunit 16
LRLLWQTRNATWSETTFELGDLSGAIEYSFTHAAIAPTLDSLILAAYQVRGTLRVYQVKIQWNMPPKTENEQQNQQATPNPALDVKALTEENAFCPASLPSVNQDEMSNGHIDSSYSYNLSKLLFVPPTPEQGTRVSNGHVVFAVFTILPPSSGMMMDVSQQWGQATSVCAAWEVQAGQSDQLSSCFDQLSVKKKAATGAPTRVRSLC